MRIYDLDGRSVKTLAALNKAVRSRVCRSQKVEVIPLEPGTYNLVTKGRGVPGAGFPKRCLVCRKEIGKGEAWEAQDNGQYSTIRHTSCIVKR